MTEDVTKSPDEVMGSTWETLGARIRAARKALGLKQEDLATKVGVTRFSVIRWEAGEHVPSPLQREKLARTLGGDPADYGKATPDPISGREAAAEGALDRPRSMRLFAAAVPAPEIEILRQHIVRLEARVHELELREAARRLLEAQADPDRRGDLLEEARSLAEAVVSGNPLPHQRETTQERE